MVIAMKKATMFEHIPFAYYKALAPASIRTYYQGEIDWIQENLGQGEMLLDVGCGAGHGLAQAVSNYEVVNGIDLSRKALLIADKMFSWTKHVWFFNVDAAEMPLMWASRYDAVICLGAGFGNMSYEAVLKEMARVVKPDGRVILSVYNEHARNAQLEFYKAAGFEVDSEEDNSITLKEGVTSTRFTKKQLEELAESVGMEATIHPIAKIGYIAEMKHIN